MSDALAGAPRLLVLLDFDGTLSPIVRRPEDATLPEVTRERLAKLARVEEVAIGIISGRAARDVQALVGLDRVHYVGNHGRERLGHRENLGDDGPQAKERLRKVTEVLDKKLGSIPGIHLEDKGCTLAVHLRRTPQSWHAEVRRGVEEVARRFAGSFHVSEGKMVFDVVPADEVSKGTATLDITREHGGLNKVLPVYCGDDTTDEAAFRALPAEAITVCVGGPEKQSAARYRLNDPGEVSLFLHRILTCRIPTQR